MNYIAKISNLTLFLVLFCGLFVFSTTNAEAKGKKAKIACTATDFDKMLKPTRYAGYSVCDGMGNPSDEQQRCLEDHGKGSFAEGVAVVKKRRKYNSWTASVPLVVKLAATGEDYKCTDMVDALNEAYRHSDGKNELLDYKDVARKIVVKDGKLALE